MRNNEAAVSSLSIHVVGDAYADLFCFLESGLPIPGGDSRLTLPIETMAGGSAVNTATHLTSLLRHFHNDDSSLRLPPAVAVQLHTCLNPHDEHGKMIMKHATRHSFPLVNCKKVDSERATGHCVVIVANDERSFMTHQGCMQDLGASDINVKALVDTPTDSSFHHCHIHIAGFYNIPGFWHGTLQQTLATIRNERDNLPCQTTTTISLVPQHDATEEWDGSLLSLLSVVDFLIMNELEADCIARRTQRDEDSKRAVREWAAFFASVSPTTYVVVTRGAHGAVALHRGHVVAAQPAVKVHVVDPTGAGDAFAAGFMRGLWKSRQTLSPDWMHTASDGNDWPVEAIQQGLYWGCSVASCSVLTRGASVPSPPEQIREFLNKTAQVEND